MTYFLACFSEDMMVETRDHGRIKISSLKNGHYVKTLSSNSTWKYTKMITFLHKDEKIVSNFYVLKMVNHSEPLKLSAEHLIAKFDQETKQQEFIFAKDIKVGDLLFSHLKNDHVRVIDISTETEKGAYAPLTEDGTLFVNNILVSCYANIQSHKLAHYSMQPIIMTSKLFGNFFNFAPQIAPPNSQLTGKTFWYSDFLISLLANLPTQISDLIYTVKL
jgi:hypothetical protein